MTEVVEELPLPDGGRILVYDDGSRHWVRGTTIVHSEGPMSEARATTPRDRGLSSERREEPRPALADAIRATLPSTSVDPTNATDMAWLRRQIVEGRAIRESRPVRSVPDDEYYFVIEAHEGWGYLIGRRVRTMYAMRASGRLGASTLYAPDKYLWGVRGSESGRAVFHRDLERAQPGTALILSDETESALADRGLLPETPVPLADLRGVTATDVATAIPQLLMELSRAAMEADGRVEGFFLRHAAEHNSDGLPGVIFVVVEGIVEYALRFVLGLAALPAVLQVLFQESGTILQALREALPMLLEGLREAPAETLVEIGREVMNAISNLTGIQQAVDEAFAGGEAVQEGRMTEAALHFTRVIGRVLDLILIVRGLFTVLRRLPAFARGAVATLRTINAHTARMRRSMVALRRGGLSALDEVEDATRSAARRSGSGAVDEASEASRRRRGGADAPDETVRHGEGLEAVDDVPDATPASTRSAAAADAASERTASSATGGSSPSHSPLAAADESRLFSRAGAQRMRESVTRLETAVREGGEMLADDLRMARQLLGRIRRLRGSGHLTDAQARRLLQFEVLMEGIESVDESRRLAAEGARLAASGARPSSRMTEHAGVELTRRILYNRGFRNIFQVVNRSNNGVDLIALARDGIVWVFEVKASAGGSAPRLSAAQHSARRFALSRLRAIAAGSGRYASSSDATRALALEMEASLRRQAHVPGMVFEYTDVFDWSRMRLGIRFWRGMEPPRSSAFWESVFSQFR